MASTSSVSVQKQEDHRRKSCETVCSSNSSCFLQKRKPIHPLASSVRSTGIRSGGSVGQRVLSAKLLRLRTLQNQLNDANFHLAELSKENRALKTLQKRQDKALAKYEGENADLPKILKTYEGEIRVLHEKNKLLRKNVRELNEQLKTKEDELFNVREQLKHLSSLTKDKNLREREKLTEEVENLKAELRKSEEQIRVLNRKLILENKTSKYKYNVEASKHKQCQRELKEALTEIQRLTTSPEQKSKNIINNNHRRFVNIPQRQAISMVSLETKQFSKSSSRSEDKDLKENTDIKTPTPESLKLEPLSPKIDSFPTGSYLNGILKSPSDSIKARLSISQKDLDDVNSEMENLHFTNEDPESQKSIYTISASNMRRSRPASSSKLDALVKPTEKKTNEEELLGDYYTKVLSSVRVCNDTIAVHKETLEQSKLDTEKLMKTLEATDKINSKLRKQSFVPDDDLVKSILKEEFRFQAGKIKDPAATDKNGNLTRKEEPTVALEDKKKLLETLKAIDNGENVAVKPPENASKKGRLIQELFGDIDN